MARAQRTNAKLGAGRVLWGRHVVYPIAVSMTRIAPRALDDDNLQTAFKSVRDGVADALGIDDRDPRVAWRYAQEKGKPPHMRIGIKTAEKP